MRNCWQTRYSASAILKNPILEHLYHKPALTPEALLEELHTYQ